MAWSRHSTLRRQRVSGKENAGTTSEATLATKYVVGFAYPVLAVFSLGVFLWHLWCYTLRRERSCEPQYACEPHSQTMRHPRWSSPSPVRHPPKLVSSLSLSRRPSSPRSSAARKPWAPQRTFFAHPPFPGSRRHAWSSAALVTDSLLKASSISISAQPVEEVFVVTSVLT